MPAADRRLTALAVLVALVFLFQLLLFPYGRDQGIYSVVADTMLGGGAPYANAWDFKTPGVFFIYALARGVFGRSFAAVRVLEALMLVLWMCGCAVFSRRHLGRALPGIVGGAIGLVLYVQLEFWHTAQPESFAAAILIWALVAATYVPAAGEDRGRIRQLAAWVASGALFALAGLMKPPLAGGTLSSLALVAASRRKRGDVRRTAGPLGAVFAFAAGGLAVAGATAAYFLLSGAWPDMVDALAGFAPRYVEIGAAAPGGFAALLGLTLWRFAVSFSPAVLIGFVLFFLLPRAHDRESEGAAHVLGCLAFQLLGIAWQGKLFHYHFGAALPLGGLVAGWAAWKLAAKMKTGWATAAALLLVAAGAWVWHPAGSPGLAFGERSWMRVKALGAPAAERNAVMDGLAAVADVDAAANRAAAEWIAERTPPGSSLFVWGFEPVIHILADRPPASRYIYNAPLRVKGYEDKARPILLRELRDRPPAAIAVESGDVLAGITGSERDSRAELERFPELREFLAAGYVRAAELRKFTIWLKAPGDARR
jgi:hypothetical protein